jgi:hypothetical protein
MTTSASGGEAYFALSTEWPLWHAYRPFVGPILKGSNGVSEEILGPSRLC